MLWEYGLRLLRWLASLLLQPGGVPKHVAFIMDGNRRFAAGKAIQKIDGHKRGYSKVREDLADSALKILDRATQSALRRSCLLCPADGGRHPLVLGARRAVHHSVRVFNRQLLALPGGGGAAHESGRGQIRRAHPGTACAFPAAAQLAHTRALLASAQHAEGGQ